MSRGEIVAEQQQPWSMWWQRGASRVTDEQGGSQTLPKVWSKLGYEGRLGGRKVGAEDVLRPRP